MPRRRRIDHPGALHFVTNRGTAQTMIYRTSANHRVFLALLGELEARFGVRVLGFVLMGNHYHLIVHSLDGRLAEAMHFLDGNYARSFNAVHDRKGSLFQGRYDDRLIRDGAHLERAGIYLHLNPLRAGLVRHPAHYRWSSLAAYRAGRSPLPWLHLDLLAGHSGSEYLDLVLSEEAAVTAIDVDDDDTIDAWCSGFDVRIEAACAESDRLVASAFTTSIDEIYIVGRKENLARTVGIVRAAQTAGAPLVVVAERYGLRTTTAIRSAKRRLRARAARDARLQTQLRELGIDLDAAA